VRFVHHSPSKSPQSLSLPLAFLAYQREDSELKSLLSSFVNEKTMRRTSPQRDLVDHSEHFLSADESSPERMEVAQNVVQGMPKLKFVQSSPHTSVSNVNGEVEVVHWVVKDRAFAIRILEEPVVRRSPTEPILEEQKESEEAMTWSDLVVKTDVVYTKSHQPVKLASDKAALGVERSVIPTSSYNHRRSANQSQMDEGAKTLLTNGAGIELQIRLAILSSHLRNDFCVHLKVSYRGILIAEWFSETIKSVSKWDKVRHLQDSSSSPAYFQKSHSKSSSSSTTTSSSSPTASCSTSSTATVIVKPRITRSNKSSQKPVSASIKQPGTATDGGPNDAATTTDSSSIQSTPPTGLSRARSGPQPSFSQLYDLSEDLSSTSSNAKSKKKKASSEEVFDMLARLQQAHAELSRLTQSRSDSLNSSLKSNSKKRKASWDPSDEAFPSETEAAMAAQHELEKVVKTTQINKKSKNFETECVNSASVHHSLAINPGETQSQSLYSQLSSNASEFLRLLDNSVLADVRSTLTSFLLTRPDLAAIVRRMMLNQEMQTPRIPATTWHAAESVPLLRDSGFMWPEDRFSDRWSMSDYRVSETEV